ncbi:MAG TPA: MATE family efflux transporter [Lachnospiraceae bacterium]|nr:MATE family efflux transporter [Lachnospiraceae bacterium]
MNQSEHMKENKMGTMPVNRLLISMALPMMISMLVQALYNIVDSMFVARLNEEALTAVSLAFPIQNLMIALGSGIGVGINALLSKSLGERNTKAANKAATNGIFLITICYLAFLLIGIFGVGSFFRSQTDNTVIVNYGIDYLRIICILSFGLFGQMTFERLLQSTGKTIYTMITQTTGAIINIILDPIFIFGYFGFPRMEVAGAALATVIGQIVAAIMAICLNSRKNTEISVKMKGFRPEKEVVGRILAVGIPSTIMVSIGSIMNFGMNKILLGFSSTAAAVFGVYFKLQSFVFMPVFGLNNGMIPIVAYNLGAKNRERLTKAYKLSVMYAVCIMIIGLAVFQILPGQLLKIFDASDTMLSIGIPALRTISLSFLLAGFCIISSSLFQALGNGLLSMVVSIARQLIVLLPVAFALSKVAGLHTVWWAFPAAEVIALTLCIIYLRKLFNQVINKM